MGFPTRISRAVFPIWEFLSSRQLLKPEKVVSAEQFNLLAWQIIGNNIAGPFAWITWDSAGVRLASGESWNLNAETSKRGVSATTGTGIYTITYAATYPNDKGVETVFEHKACLPAPQSTTANLVAVGSLAGNVATIKISAGTSGTLTNSGGFAVIF